MIGGCMTTSDTAHPDVPITEERNSLVGGMSYPRCWQGAGQFAFIVDVFSGRAPQARVGVSLTHGTMLQGASPPEM
jgi:hypothetical protein